MQIKQTLPIKLGCFALGTSVIVGTVLSVKSIIKSNKKKKRKHTNKLDINA